MSNTTSHIILLIQCVLESCIWILFSEKKKIFFFCLLLDIFFRKKKIFVSCDCNWILFSEKKKIFVSCVCNWIYNQIYSNVVSVLLDIYT